MADHVAGSVRYYLSIHKDRLENLAHVRQWSNLKVGFEGELCWIKDFDYAQVHSVEVKSIPFKDIYYEKEGKLILLDHLLSDRAVPSLLWTPIERALIIKLPSLNHNFFGLEAKLSVQLMEGEEEAEAVAMITPLTLLQNYIPKSPALRLQNLRWCILNSEQAFLLGKPLLPLPGKTYWQRKDFLLPSGFDFDLPILTDALHKRINPERTDWVLWSVEGSYSLLPKKNLTPLSRSSFRLTMAHNKNERE